MTSPPQTPPEEITAAGFQRIRGVFSAEEVHRLAQDLGRALNSVTEDSGIRRSRGAIYAARNLGVLWPGLRALEAEVVGRTPVMQCVGGQPRLVRAIYFDKPPGRSWSLPWHRDTMLAVRPTAEGATQQTVSRRAGVPHIHGSHELLQRMITARVHLDDATADNGALLVAPGSHDRPEPTPDLAPEETTHVTADAGDVLLMRPLLLHRSLDVQTTHTAHRRIVHLEFSAEPTPAPGFEWQPVYGDDQSLASFQRITTLDSR